MLKSIRDKWKSFFETVPEDNGDNFLIHCANINNSRFGILPYFNILIQMSFYLIYLYMYPEKFPENTLLGPRGYAILSIAYILTNVLFIYLYRRQKRRDTYPDYAETSNHILIINLVLYVLFESIETITEVEISGNAYRFLATFFVVSFLPIIKRKYKFFIFVLYAIFVEIGLYIIKQHAYYSNNRFQEIVLLFIPACIVLANKTYNSAVRTFSLQNSLIRLNEELRQANRQLEHLSVIDQLTQISNRRAFDQYMPLAWRSAFESNTLLTVMMIDIDKFKVFNDTYGHLKGDECLYEVASCINDIFHRKTDMVARYGGEEFIVLCTQKDARQAFAVAQKVRQAVESLKIENINSDSGRYITISVGLATETPSESGSYERLIKKADDALYTAKRNGRNQVVAAE